MPDPFAWLDEESEHTRAWMREQGEALALRLKGSHLRHAAEVLADEATGQDRWGVPAFTTNGAFFAHRAAGTERHEIVRLGPAHERTELLRLAPPEVRERRVTRWEVAPDGGGVAVVAQGAESEVSQLYVLDPMTGAALDGPFGRFRFGDLAWSHDSHELWYVDETTSDPPGRQVRRRRIGEPNSDRGCSPAGAPGNAYFTLASLDSGAMLVSWRPGPGLPAVCARVDVGTGETEPLRVDGVSARGVVRARSGQLFALVGGAAPRVMSWTPPGEPQEVPLPTGGHPPSALAALPDGRILVHRKGNGRSQLELFDPSTGVTVHMGLPSVGCIGGLGTDDTGFGYVRFSSPLIASRIVRVSPDQRTTTFWGGPAWTVDDIVVEDLTIPANGATIPTVLMWTTAGPKAPVLLTTYGSFGLDVDLEYHPLVFSWLRLGGAYAIASVRGGGGSGSAWHHAGRGAGKVFGADDLLAVARSLQKSGRPVIGWGTSAGAIPVVRAAALEPSAFAAVIVEDGLLDLATYDQDPAGRAWRDEYGSDAGPASPYAALLGGDAPLPPMLFTVAGQDGRVPNRHSRKAFAAAARRGDASLRVDLDVGHVDAGRSARSGWVADALTWLGMLGLATLDYAGS
jgi:prolyl oligopeptidase